MTNDTADERSPQRPEDRRRGVVGGYTHREINLRFIRFAYRELIAR